MELPSSAAIFTGFDDFFAWCGHWSWHSCKKCRSNKCRCGNACLKKVLGKNMLQKTFLASSHCWPSGSRCLSGRSFGSYLQGRCVTSSARRGLAGHASRFARARVGAVKCWRPDGQLKFERWRPDGQLKFWTFPCRPCLCHLPHLPGCSTQVQRKRVLRGRRNMSFCVAGAALRYATLSVVRLQKWGNYREIDHLLIYSVPENDEIWPSWCWSPLKTIPTWSQFRVIKDYGGPTCAWPRKCLQHLTTRCGAVVHMPTEVPFNQVSAWSWTVEAVEHPQVHQAIWVQDH